MSNYRENAAKVGGVAGVAAGAFDDFIEGNILSGIVDGAVFGFLGAALGYIFGGVVDYISGDEKSAKKSQSNDVIYNKLTA